MAERICWYQVSLITFQYRSSFLVSNILHVTIQSSALFALPYSRDYKSFGNPFTRKILVTRLIGCRHCHAKSGFNIPIAYPD